MRRRDRVGLLPAERVELGRLELALLVVGLVDGDDHRRRRPAEELGRFLVSGRHTDRGVDNEEDRVCLGDREAGLLLDLCLDRVVRVDLEPAGVDDDEASAVPLGVAVEAVAGRPRAILDDRGAPADDPVEERALPDVRPPDDRDDAGAGRGVGAHGLTPRRGVASGRTSGDVGSEVVRPAGVAATSERFLGELGGAGTDVGRAGDLEDPLGDVAKVLDRGGRAAGDADDALAVEHRGIGQFTRRSRSGSRACRRSRRAGSAPWCWRSSGRRRRPSGRPRPRSPSCPAGGGS